LRNTRETVDWEHPNSSPATSWTFVVPQQEQGQHHRPAQIQDLAAPLLRLPVTRKGEHRQISAASWSGVRTQPGHTLTTRRSASTPHRGTPESTQPSRTLTGRQPLRIVTLTRDRATSLHHVLNRAPGILGTQAGSFTGPPWDSRACSENTLDGAVTYPLSWPGVVGDPGAEGSCCWHDSLLTGGCGIAG
jgi:hypothetical protein